MPKILHVPVPEKYLFEVYKLLSDLAEKDPEFPRVNVPQSGTWSKEDLENLHSKLSAQGKTILLCIAKASLEDAQLTVQQLIVSCSQEGEDMAYNGIRAQLGWLSKHSKTVKRGEDSWPIVAPTEGHGGYRMPKKLAGMVLEIDRSSRTEESGPHP